MSQARERGADPELAYNAAILRVALSQLCEQVQGIPPDAPALRRTRWRHRSRGSTRCRTRRSPLSTKSLSDVRARRRRSTTVAVSRQLASGAVM